MNPIKNQMDVFNFLISKYCTRANQNDIIRRAKPELINKIVECVLNILNGKVKITDSDFQKLKPYKNLFRKLLEKKIKISNKKKLIIQRGGFLQIILPAIISAVGTIISSLISNKNETSE